MAMRQETNKCGSCIHLDYHSYSGAGTTVCYKVIVTESGRQVDYSGRAYRRKPEDAGCYRFKEATP